jgi:hypothetical protein
MKCHKNLQNSICGNKPTNRVFFWGGNAHKKSSKSFDFGQILRFESEFWSDQKKNLLLQFLPFFLERQTEFWRFRSFENFQR